MSKTRAISAADWGAATLFAALWILACANLAVHWNTNPQYGFGWLVPLLAIYLMWKRWLTRPAPELSSSTGAWCVMALLAICFLPAWVIAQPSPDWRLVNWALAGCAAGLCIGATAVTGGRRWAWHFAFPLVFILTAIPWPSGLEQPIVQGLMRLVAAITVELLNLCGIPALQRGNLIEIGTGMLGVDEACSGVRSLQATLMASLFIGELYRFTFSRRVALVFAGFAVALASNVGRTFFLSWNASRHGIDAVSQWHDRAGFTILTICFIVVWALALWMGRDVAEPETSHDIPRARPFPRPGLILLALWFAAVIAATEIWFGAGAPPSESPWHVEPPAGSNPVPIGADAAGMLRADRSVAATWRDEADRAWLLYFFEWKAGPTRSRILARLHRPEHCLPAGGWKLAAERGVITVEADGLRLPFRTYTFEQHAQRLFVYFCLWQNHRRGEQAVARFDDSTRLASLQAVLRRERRLGQVVAEFVIAGCDDATQADAAFGETAPRLIRAHRQEQRSVPK